ncbi:MAG TPA: serine hydrolase domain-containing protein [Kofleriaceae bacterium]|nr:serine hydrolase domain-containing protein [Kofleriaceae bacterium]
MRRLAFAAVTLFAALPAHAGVAPERLLRLDGSTIRVDEVDQFIAAQVKAAHVAGLAVAILEHGEVAYLRTFGWRDIYHRLPLAPDTVMYGASFSKAVFGALVATLADEKVLDLDRPVIELLGKPWSAVPRYDDLAYDPRANLITSRMLMSHTSGLANLRQLEGNRVRIHFEPGTQYAYSGEGINLMQLVVEAVTRRPVDELINERFFGPLGMARTSMTWQPALADNTAAGHDRRGRALEHVQRQKARAAGSMDTTITDFASFLSAMMRGKLISATAKQLLLAPRVAIRFAQQFPTFAMNPTDANDKIGLSYGLGWGLLTKTPYGVGYFKEGHDDGWGHYALAFDKPGIGVILMSNSDNGEQVFRAILERVLHDDVTPWSWEGYP